MATWRAVQCATRHRGRVLSGKAGVSLLSCIGFSIDSNLNISDHVSYYSNLFKHYTILTYAEILRSILHSYHILNSYHIQIQITLEYFPRHLSTDMTYTYTARDSLVIITVTQ